MKPLLKALNQEIFGNVKLKKKGVLSYIATWDELEVSIPLLDFELGEREEPRGLYKKGALLEEISWIQKSRSLVERKGTEIQGSSTRWRTLIEEETNYPG